MSVWIEITFFVAGLILIIKGGDLFVAAAVRLAEFYRMPRVVIGSTLVSLATTTPELAVSIMSGLEDAPGLAVGNAVGSVICNIGLILGITAVIKQVDVHFKVLKIPLLGMFAAGILVALMSWNLSISRLQGVLLILAGTCYFGWNFWLHWKDRSPEALKEASAIEEGVTTTRFVWLKTKPGTFVQFLLGAGIVVFGSRILVIGAVGISERMGIPPIVVGLTVVAVGTSLPELITAITSSRKSVSDLAVGNVLGANVANLTFIIGAAALVKGIDIERTTRLFDIPMMFAIMTLLFWFLYTDRRLTRKEGILLLSVYVAYLVALAVITVT